MAILPIRELKIPEKLKSRWGYHKSDNPYLDYAKNHASQLGQWNKEMREHKERFENLPPGIFIVRAPWYKRLWWKVIRRQMSTLINMKVRLTKEG